MCFFSKPKVSQNHRNIRDSRELGFQISGFLAIHPVEKKTDASKLVVTFPTLPDSVKNPSPVLIYSP